MSDRALEVLARRAQARLRTKLLQQPSGRRSAGRPTGETIQQRLEPRSIDLLAQTLRGRLLQVMRLVDDQVVIVRKQPAADLGIREQQRVVDDDEIRRFCLGASPMHIAVLGRAAHADAIERVGGDVRPKHLFTPLQPQLRAVAALSGVQPHQHLHLEAELLRVRAGLGEVAPPPSQRDVVRPALEQTRLEVPRQLRQTRQVLVHELLLQRVSVRRDHDALLVADGASERRHEVRDALARTGARLDQQRAAAGLDLRDGKHHLQLGLAVLVARQSRCQSAFGCEHGGDLVRIVRRRCRPGPRRGRPSIGDLRSGRLRIRRRQGIREEARERPTVRRDQGQHGLLEPLVEGCRILAKPQQELPGGVRVVKRAMRARLREPELDRKQRQALAGSRRHQDACHVQRVEDVRLGVPQPRCSQELQVKTSPMADRLAPADEIDQLGHRGLGSGRALEVGLRDSREPGDRVR